MIIQSKCPYCGRWPEIGDRQVWKTPIDGGMHMLYLFRLCCENGQHSFSTSFSEDLTKVAKDWERIVYEKECKLKGG